jgi:predicted GH43/DUF377 family glycosyl hydrolase
VFVPSVYFDGTVYRMWYTGSDGSRFRIGLATSPDGKHWEKYPAIQFWISVLLALGMLDPLQAQR